MSLYSVLISLGASFVLFFIKLSTFLILIFLLSSMCVTKPVPGKFNLRGDRSNDISRVLKESIGLQRMRTESANVTYVSRLQCVQAAINSHINELHSKHPNSKVAIITFNREVTIVGDGTGVRDRGPSPVLFSSRLLSLRHRLLLLVTSSTIKSYYWKPVVDTIWRNRCQKRRTLWSTNSLLSKKVVQLHLDQLFVSLLEWQKSTLVCYFDGD